MDTASDLLVVAGFLLLAWALRAMWRPLGLFALGVELVVLGFVFAVKAAKARARDAKDAAKDKQ
jgi:hypothetical protein